MSALIDLISPDVEKFAKVGIVHEILADDIYNIRIGNKIIRMKSAIGDIGVGYAVVVSKTDYGYHIVGVQEKREITIAQVDING